MVGLVVSILVGIDALSMFIGLLKYASAYKKWLKDDVTPEIDEGHVQLN